MGRRRRHRNGASGVANKDGTGGGECQAAENKRPRLERSRHDASPGNRADIDLRRLRETYREIESSCRKEFDTNLIVFWNLRAKLAHSTDASLPTLSDEQQLSEDAGEDAMSRRAVASPLLRIPATVFNSLLYAAMSQQPPRAEEALQLFSTMQEDGFSPTEASYTTCIRAKVSLGLLDEALSTASNAAKLLGAGVKLRMFSPVMTAFAQAGHLDKVHDVEREILNANLRPLEPECRDMLVCAIKANNKAEVWKMIRRIVDEFRVIESETMRVIQDYFNAERPGAAKIVESIPETGVFPNCNTKLRPIYLNSRELDVFQSKVKELAVKRETFEGFSNFQEWATKNGPFGAVVDGANVGLYHSNYEGGKFSFAQVRMVMKAVQQKLGLDKPPLLVLHKRRCEKGPAKDEEAQNYLAELRKQRRLYASPPGSNDDWYWLWAAVSEGSNGYLVTNDEMRDHIFEQLGPCYFHRWKERHMIRFHFKKQEVHLTMPDPFSKYCQKGESKRKTSDKDDSADGAAEDGASKTDHDDENAVWHFISRDGKWLCVS